MDSHQIKTTLLLAGKKTIPQVLEDVQSLRLLDAGQEKKEKTWLLLGLAGVVLAVLFFLLLVTGDRVWAIPFFGVSVIWTITAFVVKVRVGRLNLDNRRYEFLYRILRLLQADTAENGEIDLHLDLRAHNHQSKLLRKGEVRGWKVRYYVDPWLKLQGRLLDGTRYCLTMIEKVQHRSRWKRSRSGKSKHKTKTKSSCEALLSLRPKLGRYRPLQQLQSDLAGAVQLPSWAACTGIQAENDTYSLRAAARTRWDVPSPGKTARGDDAVELVAMMFLSLYQALNLARNLQKSGGDQSPS